MSYIQELQDVIRRLHGAEAKHIESVPVKETFQGKTVWEGIVEVFELRGHPEAYRAYAWARPRQSTRQNKGSAQKAARSNRTGVQTWDSRRKLRNREGRSCRRARQRGASCQCVSPLTI